MNINVKAVQLCCLSSAVHFGSNISAAIREDYLSTLSICRFIILEFKCCFLHAYCLLDLELIEMERVTLRHFSCVRSFRRQKRVTILKSDTVKVIVALVFEPKNEIIKLLIQ